MAVEKERGCGFRKVGGLYLVGPELSAPCDRLPLNLCVCPTCGHGVKFGRGFQWLQAFRFFGRHEKCTSEVCRGPLSCNVCTPPDKAGLLWIGEKFYSPASFCYEAVRMGISKRISQIPRGLEIGKTVIYLAHKLGGTDGENLCPGIFSSFVPSRLEMIITETQSRKPRFMAKLEKRGITPVVVPDDDPDHNPAAARRQARERKAKTKHPDLDMEIPKARRRRS